MLKKLAKIKYLPNNFQIIQNGDHVVCAVSGKKISLDNLTYWNVELQEAYYSPIEVNLKFGDFAKFKFAFCPSISGKSGFP